jgi:electron transfer flavoprotein beta subunit
VRELKYVVAMKQVPDLQQLRMRNGRPVLEDVPVEFGKIDKNALETAVQLQEANGGEVVVVSVGNEELMETIKEAMAAGADSASLIVDDDTAELSSLDNARLLAQLIQEIDDIGLIFFAEGSADNYSGQVGSEVAEILDLPQVGYVNSVRIDGDKAVLTRVLEKVYEEIEVALPAVVIVAADLNTPRLPSVMQVLKAGKKPKEIQDLSDVDYEKVLSVKTLDALAPDTSRKMQELKDEDEIVGVLKDDGFIGR